MIDRIDISAVDEGYFEVVEIKDYVLVLKSKSTGHYWSLLEQVYNGCRFFQIGHRHHAADPYHIQKSKPTVAGCCEYIRGHDAYQLGKEHEKELRRQRRQVEKREKRAFPE